jgi:hypothetical protein
LGLSSARKKGATQCQDHLENTTGLAYGVRLFGLIPKEKLIAVLMMQAAPLQARYYRSLIRNLTSQALID